MSEVGIYFEGVGQTEPQTRPLSDSHLSRLIFIRLF